MRGRDMALDRARGNQYNQINKNNLNLQILEHRRGLPGHRLRSGARLGAIHRREVKGMAKKGKGASSSGCAGVEASCCRVEALVSVDERGQMVLPKEMRERAGIKAGDKLAAVSFERDGKVCCIALIRAEDFAATVRGMLGPMVSELAK